MDDMTKFTRGHSDNHVPPITKRQAKHAEEEHLVLYRLVLNMQNLKDKDRKKGSITALGKVAFTGPISARTAELIVEARDAGVGKRLTRVHHLLMRLLDGTKGPHEIHENTGLPMKECEEIYAVYRDTDPDLWVGKDIPK